ncbi:hypothetical protein MATL_G00140130 [Megalops atlanticus]|uniref:Uncharacterized protein n=1 Tax=Megalops atlanticus TaxID=7932 RepID=A0A9D3PVP8_MEGAT|nr:hypothetical protein MATL_G00140130 [Megalops atlanticus]
MWSAFLPPSLLNSGWECRNKQRVFRISRAVSVELAPDLDTRRQQELCNYLTLFFGKVFQLFPPNNILRIKGYPGESFYDHSAQW